MSYADPAAIEAHIVASQPMTALSAPDSEAAVVGAILSGDPDAAQLLEGLTPSHFTDQVLRRVVESASRRARPGAVLEPALIAADLQGFEPLTAAGGLAYLSGLSSHSGVWAAPDHVAILKDRHIRRATLSALDGVRKFVCTDLETDGFEHVATLSRATTALLDQCAPDDAAMIDARSAALARVAKIEEEARVGRPRGLITGLRCFDYRMRGLRPGWLVIIAGRPSMGKTALARSTAMATAARNPDRLVVYFCLEMDRDEMSDRSLSEASYLHDRLDAIAYQDMGGDTLDREQRALLPDLAGRIPPNFIIEDSATLTVEHVRRRLYALRRQGKPLGAVFIDYLQIMQRPDIKGANDATILQRMTMALKNLARELGICIVLLSQLNRAVEGRENKRPMLSDLRESGGIEQDANAVLFCYRWHYYLARNEPKAGSAEYTAWEVECENERRVIEVICPKNRGGAIFNERQTYFAEFDHIEDQPA